MKQIEKILLSIFCLAALVACQNVDELSQEEQAPSAGLERDMAANPDAIDKVTGDELPPIKWYAIENEGNDNYWKSVDCERLWVEFEKGISLIDPDVDSFLARHSLTNIDRKSPRPELTNYYVFEHPNGNKESVLAIVKDAMQTDFILFAEPASKYSKSFSPNDEFYEFQWGHFVISSEEAWNDIIGGSWNVIAVIDDAVDYNHEDLADQVWYGWDYGFNDADPAPDVADQIHGTHVTGIIGASINNNVGVAGMVNDTVYFAKVTDANYNPEFGNFSDAAIVDALYDIAEIDRVGTVNMSLGAASPSAALEQACATAANAGKLLIAASGNDGTAVISFPAAFNSCMAVGSVGTDGYDLYLADYSQFGNEQEVVAPGGDGNTGYGILSTVPGNNYDALQGTSMATPFVAGLAGMIQAINPDLSANEVRTIIQQCALDLGNPGWDDVFGYGLINAECATQMALNGGTDNITETETIDIKLFPNPVVDLLHIERGNFEGNWEIHVLSIHGQLLRTEYLSNGSNRTQLNLSDMSNGTYILEVVSSDSPLSNQIIHQQIISKS